MVGVRELDQSKLTGNQTNWINEHTFYTHGYGFVAAAASSDVTNTKEFTEGDIPPTGPLGPDARRRCTTASCCPDYSIVGAPGSPREYDGADVKTTYAGSGGVSLSNVFTRLAFGMKYRETNFLLNDAASAKGAKIIFDRDPAAAGGEGRAVPDRRRRPVPGGDRRPDRSGSSTPTPRWRTTRTRSGRACRT